MANKEENGDNSRKGAPTKSIADLFKKLSIQEQPESPKKDMKDYKFWKTQPVTKFDESVLQEGPIDSSKKTSDIPKEPFPMLPQFEWVTLDIDKDEEMTQLYELLYDHYVEDHDSTFRFAYNKDFFNWALKPPGWNKEWHLGVRVKATKRLVAFISGVPANLKVRDHQFRAVEINFLCVHKKLRNKRLAPLLIKEITRRINLCDIWQALYTSGTVLPSPITVCRYAHRPLNWEKLYDVGFSALPEDKTKAQMMAKFAISSSTKTRGLRKMRQTDIDAVFDLYNRFQKRYEVSQEFTKEELSHWLLGDAHERTLSDSDKVIMCYVVENEDGRITDFFSFYILPFSVLNRPSFTNLGVAYLYYYASDTASEAESRFDSEATKKLTKRLESLVSDALVLAKNVGVDVFNALTSQDNVLFLEDLKFGPGDGFLNYYLFNYKAFPVPGGFDKTTNTYDTEKRSGMGVVML
ncbi:hypothetical protein FOA43_002175 [Brettanomyces nanus]|uniref:Glycylpeptide N-tetradecanoyltransferase n=1 Tax=Eeniella nana TaxID=13502 RepID=A0A875S4Z6_EENNA|nr:uncharacterized protein FOA43_002175 [Brettanomyces nanus]QPG74839.1 hypothetical protein FOA43_002175 [Brettanomyces nanus]